MNIIVINETSNLGGAETMAVELANALVLLPGYHVVFASSPGILSGRLDNRIRFIAIARYSPAVIFRLFREFKRIFQGERFDLMHAQGATIGIIAGIAARMFSPKTKVIITHHSSDFTRIPPFAANFLFKKLTDMLIAISAEKYNSFMRAGFSAKKAALIPNFVDRERLYFYANPENVLGIRNALGVLPDEKVVVNVGRLLPGKRLDVFIRSLTSCAMQSAFKIFGIIVGEGPERERLQSLIDQCSAPNLRIKLMGFQDNVPAYLKTADLLLFTSEHEVLPMSLIEAISLGVPIICADIPGNNDIVKNGFNGFLVDPRETDYSVPVLRLLNDAELSGKFSLNGIEKSAAEYDKNKIVAKIAGLYEALIDHDKR
ncbi:MAG: glycosyltransferase [Candidatus Omnitrophota bacterium]|jgi:glycosyltransferase EpsD